MMRERGELFQDLVLKIKCSNYQELKCVMWLDCGVSEYSSEGTHQAHLGAGTDSLPSLSNIDVFTLDWLEE